MSELEKICENATEVLNSKFLYYCNKNDVCPHQIYLDEYAFCRIELNRKDYIEGK